MTEKKDDRLNRRDFIHRSIKAGISISLAGATSLLLYDGKGPSGKAVESKKDIPSFSVPPVAGRTMAIVQGQSRTACIRQAIESLGGIKRFVQPGSRVVIKPNVAFASSPALGATTSPQSLTELITLCFSGGAKEVRVLDNPINDPASCFYLSGIEQACKTAGARLIYPEDKYFTPVTLSGGKLIKDWPFFYDPLTDCDTLIGIAPLKSHHRSGASMTMKNWYGLLGGRRNIFHQNIHTIIAELAILVRPSLVILDGFDVMVRNGPTGGSLSDLQQKNTIIASCDQVAADAYGATLLGLKPKDLPYLAKAEQAGAGIVNYKQLNPIMIKAG